MDLNIARRRLEAEWTRLLAAQDAAAPTGGLPPTDPQQSDLGSEVLERETELAVRDSVDSELRDLHDAFRRIEAGTYGRCETCDVPITESRLTAAPATRFCVEHERLWELHARMPTFPEEPQASEAPSAERVAEREAIQHLEFVADDDDELEERVELSAEESALHYVNGVPHAALDPTEVEWLEETEWQEAEDEQTARDLELLELRQEVVAVTTPDEAPHPLG